jgi:hypothetical protein
MARVHLFTSHHSGDQKHHQADKAFASLSAQEQSTIAHTHKEASDEPHTLDVTAVASPNLTDDQAEEKSKKAEKESIQLPASSAALAAALLQNQSSINVVETLTAALSAKKGKIKKKKYMIRPPWQFNHTLTTSNADIMSCRHCRGKR